VSQAPHRILVLGAYGFFGARICTALARNPRIRLLLAGRDLAKATALAYQLGLGAESARRIDAADPQLALQLRKLGVNTLIHTVGPFQGQDYAIARAAISAGANYLDLADGREFVSRITTLDAAARAAGVFVVSGVSSLPALTAAVVDEYREAFKRLDSIRIGLSSGAIVPGIATIRAVLSYCGKPIRVWENGAWAVTHGWLDTRRHEFPKLVGSRLLGRCDVPDLELLPQRYPGVQTVSFHAGFASDAGHRLVERLGLLVRDGRLESALPFAGVLNTLGRWMRPFVSDRGAMFITLGGLDKDGNRHEITWNIVARDNHGPHIPCAAAIALAGKIAAGQAPPAGAMPCLGLLTIEDMTDTLKGLSIRELVP
jgi:saccharopine dehydrogenase-like NADP-dependent oxidoreductase